MNSRVRPILQAEHGAFPAWGETHLEGLKEEAGSKEKRAVPVRSPDSPWMVDLALVLFFQGVCGSPMDWGVSYLPLPVLSVLLVTPIAPGKSGLVVQKQVATGPYKPVYLLPSLPPFRGAPAPQPAQSISGDCPQGVQRSQG